MNKENIKKVVLAYSGGLDTSIIIPWLKENYNNCEVIAVSGNVGQADELEGLEEKALKTGASKLYVLDLTEEYVDEVLAHFTAENMLLLQNEVNMLPYIVDKAYEKGMQIALNPSPYNEKLDAVDMKKISIFLLNEVEGAQVTGLTDPEEIIAKMKELFPHAKIVLTLGKDGAMYADAEQKHYQPIF